jgi:hypothetical protein
VNTHWTVAAYCRWLRTGERPNRRAIPTTEHREGLRRWLILRRVH